MARTEIHPGEHLAEELKELGMSAALHHRRTPRCVWPISSARVRNSGSTCKAFANCASLRRNWEGRYRRFRG